MDRYETVMIINKNIDEKNKNKIIDDIKKCILENGKIIKEEDLGTKLLAYEVKGHKEANYYLIEFESNQETSEKLETIYRNLDEILKFIVVKLDW